MANVPKHGSLRPFSEEVKDIVSSSRFSNATRPNAHARSDLINRVSSNVLNSVPTCINPKKLSSVDCKENLPPHDSENNPQAELLLKTSKLQLNKSIVRALPSRRLRQIGSANPLREKNQLNLQHYLSATINKATSNALSPKKRVLLTETRQYVVRSSPRTERSLMAQPEFKIPLTTKDTRKIVTIRESIVVNKKCCSILTQLGSQEPCMVKTFNDETQENLPSHHIKNKHPAALVKTLKPQLTKSTLSTFPSGKRSIVAEPKFKVPKSIVVNKKPYKIVSQIGSGGSSIVFYALDSQKKVFVVKYVSLKGFNHLMREGFKKEIEFLKKLQGSNRVIRLFDFECRENKLLLVLEKGGIDLANYISKEKKPLGMLFIKYFWEEMLKAVADIHKFGIVHCDLKPENFVCVGGGLKLIDFGIAIAVPKDKTSAFRDIPMGTLHYMSPEAITQLLNGNRIRCNVKSDIWSLGCILYKLVYGVTPFQNYNTPVEKIYAFTRPGCIFGKTPFGCPEKLLVDVLKKCLEHDPKKRASIEELLKHPYLT